MTARWTASWRTPASPTRAAPSLRARPRGPTSPAPACPATRARPRTVKVSLQLNHYFNFAHLLFEDETAEFIDKIQFNFSQKFNYADAMKFCKDRNSRLIEIDTREQMKAVAAKLQRVVDTGSLEPHCFKGCPGCRNECYTAFWTGASDEAQEGTWVWSSSGTQDNMNLL